MPVSGVVITCQPGLAGKVSELVVGESGVEVYGCPDNATIIAVIESDTVQGEVDTVKRLSDIDGVQTVRLAYHNFEDLTDGQVDTDPARKES